MRSEEEAPPLCLECGACCFSDLETAIRVTGDDHERLGEDAARLVRFVGNRAYMRLTDGHCAALRVEPEGRFVCSVYEARPVVCRDLERGSPHCAAERFAKQARATERLVQLRRL
jgi:Fe-S-cluster containining protein